MKSVGSSVASSAACSFAVTVDSAFLAPFVLTMYEFCAMAPITVNAMQNADKYLLIDFRI